MQKNADKQTDDDEKMTVTKNGRPYFAEHFSLTTEQYEVLLEMKNRYLKEMSNRYALAIPENHDSDLRFVIDKIIATYKDNPSDFIQRIGDVKQK